MRFTKMHGAGNDFVVINNMIERMPEEKMGAVARRVCTRRLSVGADGVMFVDRAEGDGDYRMRFYNSDGSLGEMCGNGARCIARYGYENGLAGEVQRIETTAGLVTGWRISERLYRVRLNDPSVLDIAREAVVDGVRYVCGYVELGNPGLPHAVVELEDWDTLPEEKLRSLGRALRYHAAFPKGANVTFVRKLGDNALKAVTFERGVEDFTLACGTGCGATTAVVTLRGRVTGVDTRIEMPGGTLSVTLAASDGAVRDIFLTGPTNIVCEGELTDEDLSL